MRKMNETRDSLLLSKLQIPLPLSATVPRPGLIGWLNEGLSRKATLVTAPAGYGKTTLVSDWVRQLPIPAGWVTGLKLLSLSGACNQSSGVVELQRPRRGNG